MQSEFPPAVPEIPVNNIDRALEYYESCLGFHRDWGDEDGGIAGISNGHCRMFLTNPSFRETYGNVSPVLVWLNFNSKDEVRQQYALCLKSQARIVSGLEEKPWKLLEFTIADPDGNLFRVFYDFSRDEQPAPQQQACPGA
jgi:uncharacterized glyoxalase superfamily protein PhnB